MTNELLIRFAIFGTVFAALAAWEWFAPAQPSTTIKPRCWRDNFAILLIDIGLVRLIFPFATVGVAEYSHDQHVGLFNQVAAPAWLAVVGSILALDMTIYFQHRLFHAVPWLWRAHRMHHSDTQFDISTGVRFHPLEIGASLLIKFAAVAMLGAPPLAVLVFEVLLNATSLFNHGNIRLPAALARILPLLLVTPAMHRLHHSSDTAQTNTNFSFCLPWWDWAFGTFLDPAANPPPICIGLEEFRDNRSQRLDQLLIQPFAAEPVVQRPQN